MNQTLKTVDARHNLANKGFITKFLPYVQISRFNDDLCKIYDNKLKIIFSVSFFFVYRLKEETNE